MSSPPSPTPNPMSIASITLPPPATPISHVVIKAEEEKSIDYFPGEVDEEDDEFDSPSSSASLRTKDPQDDLGSVANGNPALVGRTEQQKRRKISHSAIEKRRRQRINERIAQLQALIPDCAGRENLQMAFVLQLAVEHMERLISENAALKSQAQSHLQQQQAAAVVSLGTKMPNPQQQTSFPSPYGPYFCPPGMLPPQGTSAPWILPAGPNGAASLLQAQPGMMMMMSPSPSPSPAPLPALASKPPVLPKVQLQFHFHYKPAAKAEKGD